MSQHISQARPDAMRSVRRNDATLAAARSREGTRLQYTYADNPYDRSVDEYEMPDGEIVQRSDALQRVDR